MAMDFSKDPVGVEMALQALDGVKYKAIAKERKVSLSAVHQRVKKIARAVFDTMSALPWEEDVCREIAELKRTKSTPFVLKKYRRVFEDYIRNQDEKRRIVEYLKSHDGSR